MQPSHPPQPLLLEPLLMVNLTDKATVSSRTLDSRGNLHVRAIFSRVGIQRYTARELGLQGRPPGDILRVFRPEEEVFAQDSLDSFENAPVTDDHPPENVTSANFRKYAVGVAVGKRVKEGDHTAGDILISDAATIAKIDNGKAELSDGYACEVELKSGTWNGQDYDAIKRNIRGNHIAIVGAGRCGGSCRILDGVTCEVCGGQDQAPCNCHESETDMTTGGQPSPQLIARLVDGLTIQTTEQGAQAIDKLTAQLADAASATAAIQKKLDDAEVEHKKAIDAKDGEITGLKAQVTDEALDQRVVERASLVTSVTKVMGADYDAKGKSNIDLMTDVATKAFGAAAVKDRSPEYIEALYTSVNLQSAGNNDTVRAVVGDALQPTPRRQTTVQRNLRDGGDGAEQPRGREAYLQRLNGGRNAIDRQHGNS